MKAFLWVVLLAFLGLCLYYIILSAVPDEGRMISIAFGNPAEDTVELHVELSLMLASEDTWPYLTEGGGVDWNAWAKDHYIVKDDAGNQIEFTKHTKSNVITEKETRTVAEGFLVGTVKQGTKYSFTYVPVVGQPEQFLYEFTAPAGDQKRMFVNFDPL